MPPFWNATLEKTEASLLLFLIIRDNTCIWMPEEFFFPSSKLNNKKHMIFNGEC